MVDLVRNVLRESKDEGYPLTRAVGCMEWCLGDYQGIEDIVEYEARLNYILEPGGDPIICTYDISKHSAEVILGVLQTHPAVIINGTLQVNPFYIAPDEFLAGLSARKKAARA